MSKYFDRAAKPQQNNPNNTAYNVPNPYTGCCGNQGYYNGCNRCA